MFVVTKGLIIKAIEGLIIAARVMSSAFVRQSFNWPSLPGANWFPGHMAKAMKQTLKKISKCQCIIEVHDARVSSSF